MSEREDYGHRYFLLCTFLIFQIFYNQHVSFYNKEVYLKKKVFARQEENPHQADAITEYLEGKGTVCTTQRVNDPSKG